MHACKDINVNYYKSERYTEPLTHNFKFHCTSVYKYASADKLVFIFLLFLGLVFRFVHSFLAYMR